MWRPTDTCSKETYLKMKKLLEYLVSSIVQNPNEIEIKEKMENSYVNLILTAHADDIKTIIGKNGRTIKALRELLKIKALKEGKRINIILNQ